MSLAKLVDSWRSLNVLVIGEAMLDCYLSGHVERLCREAPVPIVDISECRDVGGGAANTAANVASLGAKVDLLSVVGKDQISDRLQESLQQCGVLTDGLIRDTHRTTLAKQRIIADAQLLVRFDSGSTENLSPILEQQLIDYLKSQFTSYDAVIISDYGYGILTPRIIETLATLQFLHPRVLVVDSKRLKAYSKVGVTAVKPNYEETLQLLGLNRQKHHRIEQITPYGDRLLELTGASMVVVTLDTEGASLFQRDQPPIKISASAAPHHHATGAGDTFASALALSLAHQDSPSTALTLAATAAAVVVQEAGTTLCQLETLKRSLIDSRYCNQIQSLVRS